MYAPCPDWLPWLRKLSVHLWAFAQYTRTSLQYTLRIARANTIEQRNQLFTSFIRTLINTADALIQRTPKKPITRWKRRAYLRSWYYSQVVLQLAVLPRDWQSGLSHEDLLQVIRLGELALQHYESGGVEVVGATRKWKRFGAIAARQMRCIHRAFFRISLASLYLRLNAGDLSRNLEVAFSQYRSAADLLERENLPVLSLYGAAVRALLGTAFLQYPTDRREDYAQQAVESFAEANKIISLYCTSADPPIKTVWNDAFWRGLPFVPRLQHAALFSSRLSWGGVKMLRKGVPDRYVTGALLPAFAFWVDWQLGVAYRQLGRLEKAIEHFELALQGPTKDTEDFQGLRAAVEVDKGNTYLRKFQSAERKENLNLAIKSFQNALVESVKDGCVRTDAMRAYALALVGDGRSFFELFTRGVIKLEGFNQYLPLLVDQLRSAARVARIAAAPEIAQDALFLLGMAYASQSDYVRAYRAVVAASRVADRVGRHARTLRTVRYLMGTGASLDAFLVRMTLHARRQSKMMASKDNSKVRVVPLRFAFQFAERGRTVFLATQLRSLKLLPQGAGEEEVAGLFERRRLWHEAELKLREQESSPGTENKVLITLRERRNVLESDYFAELEKVREKFCDARYDPDRPVLPIRPNEFFGIIKELSREVDTALVEYYFTGQHLMAFVLLPSCLHQVYVDISRDELAAIEYHWEKGRDAMRSPKHWENGYLLQVLTRLQPAAEGPAKSIAEYEETTGRRIKRVIIVPHRFLHLIPLHAIQLPSGKRWGEAFSIRYTPSVSVLSLLLRSHSAQEAGPSDHLSNASHRKALSVSYSSATGGRSLLFNFEEARAVAEATGGELLSGLEATPSRVKEEMRDVTYVHFACHGTFDRNAPLDAALELAPNVKTGGECDVTRDGTPKEVGTSRQSDGRLTLAEIFRSVHLPRAELVVLSACETGVTKVEEQYEEYIGLSAGFLYAGASTVVSTLWPVADVGTWLLMRSFAQQVVSGVRPSVALRYAQQELRSLSSEYVQQQIYEAASRESDPCRREQMIEGAQQFRGELPFAGPYWWAGFSVNGLG